MEKTRFLRAYFRAEDTSEDGPLKFVASTANVGRDGWIIEADAWELDNYRKNPVVLWVHDYRGQTLPIGRTEDVKVTDEQLEADVRFDPDDEFAQRIEGKYRKRYLNAVSVGWDTHELLLDPDGDEPPRVQSAELLDISAVPVPGDADALIKRQLRALQQLGITPGADPEEVFARAGKMLSKRNREDLEEAGRLIGDVLKRAAEDDTDDDEDRSDQPDGNVVSLLEHINSRLEDLTTERNEDAGP